MKDAGKSSDIPPLSEQSWARIERGVFAALDAEAEPRAAPRRAKLWLGLILIVPAAAAGMFLARVLSPPRPPDPTVARVVTGGAAGSRYSVGEATLAVAPEAVLIVSGDDEHGVVVLLERGRVDCEVSPRGRRPPFVLQAGDLRARVLGTSFSARRIGDGARIDVRHGVVEVTAPGRHVILHDGQTFAAEEIAKTEPVAAVGPAPVSAPVPAPVSVPGPVSAPVPGPAPAPVPGP